ncbi:MAG: thiamine pyrophosphate-dependent enzyme, partial [Pseudomonadota bacterium]|nr:thiamine pyrophosphate-dependent enzyme [Pseudomonadota bacterium]
SGTILSGGWPQRLWDIRQHHQFIGDSGGYGVGYGAPASLGAALAHRPHGRFVVNVQADGDLMYGPGALWTAAHHGVPYLSVMHNNRGYHQEVMHLQRMTLRRQRGGRPAAEIGNTFDEPRIDYAQLAASMGVWSSGPVTNPADLSGVLTRAAQVVDSGEPALVDVRCQPR